MNLADELLAAVHRSLADRSELASARTVNLVVTPRFYNNPEAIAAVRAQWPVVWIACLLEPPPDGVEVRAWRNPDLYVPDPGLQRLRDEHDPVAHLYAEVGKPALCGHHWPRQLGRKPGFVHLCLDCRRTKAAK